jgi:ArsR family transcriptional regulator, arsenate/arsenite/antimonite-responsive transcriptional repressor
MSATLVFKALADPTRRSIIDLLKEKDMTAGEIAEQFNMKKPSISHHLSTLQTAGLVLSERSGQHIIYSLNTTVFQDIMMWMMNVSGKENKK